MTTIKDMTGAADEALLKLPKWARERIENAEQEAQRLRDTCDAMTRPDARDVWSVGYPPVEHAIPEHANIRYAIAEQVDKHARIDIRREDDETILINGSWTLSIEPQASNMVKIKLVSR